MLYQQSSLVECTQPHKRAHWTASIVTALIHHGANTRSNCLYRSGLESIEHTHVLDTSNGLYTLVSHLPLVDFESWSPAPDVWMIQTVRSNSPTDVELASTLRRSDAQTLRHSDAQTLRRSDTQTLRRSDAQTLRRSGAQALRRSDAQTLRRSDAQTLRRSDAHTQIPTQTHTHTLLTNTRACARVSHTHTRTHTNTHKHNYSVSA